MSASTPSLTSWNTAPTEHAARAATQSKLAGVILDHPKDIIPLLCFRGNLRLRAAPVRILRGFLAVLRDPALNLGVGNRDNLAHRGIEPPPRFRAFNVLRGL